jgi:hypothetical protein
MTTYWLIVCLIWGGLSLAVLFGFLMWWAEEPMRISRRRQWLDAAPFFALLIEFYFRGTKKKPPVE